MVPNPCVAFALCLLRGFVCIVSCDVTILRNGPQKREREREREAQAMRMRPSCADVWERAAAPSANEIFARRWGTKTHSKKVKERQRNGVPFYMKIQSSLQLVAPGSGPRLFAGGWLATFRDLAPPRPPSSCHRTTSGAFSRKIQPFCKQAFFKKRAFLRGPFLKEALCKKKLF